MEESAREPGLDFEQVYIKEEVVYDSDEAQSPDLKHDADHDELDTLCSNSESHPDQPVGLTEEQSQDVFIKEELTDDVDSDFCTSTDGVNEKTDKATTYKDTNGSPVGYRHYDECQPKKRKNISGLQSAYSSTNLLSNEENPLFQCELCPKNLVESQI